MQRITAKRSLPCVTIDWTLQRHVIANCLTTNWHQLSKRHSYGSVFTKATHISGGCGYRCSAGTQMQTGFRSRLPDSRNCDWPIRLVTHWRHWGGDAFYRIRGGYDALFSRSGTQTLPALADAHPHTGYGRQPGNAYLCSDRSRLCIFSALAAGRCRWSHSGAFFYGHRPTNFARKRADEHIAGQIDFLRALVSGSGRHSHAGHPAPFSSSGGSRRCSPRWWIFWHHHVSGLPAPHRGAFGDRFNLCCGQIW